MEMNLVVLLVCAAAVVVAGISDDSKVNTIHHHLSKRELHMLFGASHHSEVPAYKLVVPTDLHGGIVKRHADVIDDQLHYKFEGLHDDDEPFELLLHRKMEPLSPTFVMVERHEDISQNRMRHVESPSCYYFANVTSHANSIAAVSTCDGLRGVIMTPRSHYMIQPVPSSLIRRHRRSTDGAAADAILETSHFLYEVEPNDIHCPVDAMLARSQDVVGNERLLKLDDELSSSSATHRRRRAAKTKQKIVELAIFFDNSLYEKSRSAADPENKEILKYILASVNGMNLLYHRSAFKGYKVTFKVVRLEILKTKISQLPDDGEADFLLKQFRVYQETLNPEEGIPGHWDNAILMTGLDMYVQFGSRVERSVTGYAHVAAMCNRATSCSVNEGRGFSSLYSIAHEIGHNFGMVHDGTGNTCPRKGYLMSAESVVVGIEWSHCSRKDFIKYIGMYECLDNDPSAVIADHDPAFIGQRFDADLQCQIYTGSEKSERSKGPSFPIADICRVLWCRDPSNSHISRGAHPALEGTYCGAKKWCRRTKCVGWGNAAPPVIDGAWGEYSLDGQCTSTCLEGGTGVKTFTRKCNNPRPLNGGRECSASHTKTETCDDTEICRKENRTAPSQYAAQLCRDFAPNAEIGSKDISTSCSVRCQVAVGGGYYRVIDKKFPDGKSCSDGHCMQGACAKTPTPPTTTTTTTMPPTTTTTTTTTTGSTTRAAKASTAATTAAVYPSSTTQAPTTSATTRSNAPVDGGWSELTVVKHCDANATCLAGGVTFKKSKRQCNKPLPKHGGKKCDGPAVVMDICPRSKACAEATQTSTDFASAYCHRLTKLGYYKTRLSGSGKQIAFRKPSGDTTNVSKKRQVACITACQGHGANNRYSLFRNYFPDGTPCGARGVERHYCLNHSCVEFDCSGKLKTDDSPSTSDENC